MGLLIGLAGGVGLFLLVTSGGSRRPRRRSTRDERLLELITAAGLTSVSPLQVTAGSVVAGLMVGVLVAGLSGVLVLGLVTGMSVGRAPTALLRRRARERRGLLREVWPDAVDSLASGVRAGLSLPESLAALSERGPAVLRPAFARFGEDYRVSTNLELCLDHLSLSLADPTADQVVETVRLTRQVGGSDLGSVLRTLSTFLRAEARTRAELEARQSWSVNAARLALVAPWAVLALLATGSQATVNAYNRPAGLVVLAVGAAVSVLAYQLMLRLGRLPDPPRVLRPARGTA